MFIYKYLEIMKIYNSFNELAVANGAPTESMYVRGVGKRPTKNHREILEHIVCLDGNDFYVYYEPFSDKYGWDSSKCDGSGTIYDNYHAAYYGALRDAAAKYL